MTTRLTAILATTTAIIAGAAQADEVIFAHGANPGNPRCVAAESWAAAFGTCTGGRHNVNVAPSATMGDDVAMLTSSTAGMRLHAEITSRSSPRVARDRPATRRRRAGRPPVTAARCSTLKSADRSGARARIAPRPSARASCGRSGSDQGKATGCQRASGS